MNAEAGPSKPRLQDAQATSTKAWPVDMDSPFLIVKATGIGAVSGGLVGGTYGVLKSVNPFQVSLRMGGAWGFVFFQFFALREYLVSPLLLRNGITPNHRARYALLNDPRNGGRYPPDSASSTEELRTQRVLDSGLAGFLGGAILRVTTSGLRLRAMIPAGITGLLFASTAQYGINNLRVSRLRMLAARQEGREALEPRIMEGRSMVHPPDGARAPTMDTTDRLLPLPAVPSEDNRSGWGVLEDPTKPVAEPAKSLPARIMGVASAILPVRSLSDQEYLDVLLKKQAGVEKRLTEIAAEEERLFERGRREEGGEKVW